MVWAGDESQTGLIKTKNCSTKISFITKLDVTYLSLAQLLLMFMHILKKKKKKILSQHKNRNTQKLIQSFQHHISYPIRSWSCIKAISGSSHSCVRQAFIQALLFTVVFPQRLSFFTGKVSNFGPPDPWKMHFRHTFWLQSISCSSLINTIYPVNIMVWW